LVYIALMLLLLTPAKDDVIAVVCLFVWQQLCAKMPELICMKF